MKGNPHGSDAEENVSLRHHSEPAKRVSIHANEILKPIQTEPSCWKVKDIS